MISSKFRTPLFVVGFFSFFFVLSTSFAAAGTISPGTYRLLDHGFGNQGPDYGLRVDALSNTLFSTELGGVQTLLTWSGGSTATISGTLHNNTTTDIWQVNYVLTGVVAVGTQGFTATMGSGTLTDPLSNVTPINGEINGAGIAFDFLADGHRLPGDSDTAVGRGWLLPPNSTDDWLVRAELIPEPGSALLISLGLASLSFCPCFLRRRVPRSSFLR